MSWTLEEDEKIRYDNYWPGLECANFSHFSTYAIKFAPANWKRQQNALKASS